MEKLEIELDSFKTKVDGPTVVTIHQPADAEDQEKKSVSIDRSQLTHSTCGGGNQHLDLAIEELEKDHYLYRRGSTQVHVQTFEPSAATDGDRRHMFYNGLKIFSSLLGMLLLIITLDIKMSSAITSQVSEMVVDQYTLTLYAFGFLWTTYYILKGVFRNQDELKFLKSHQSSNRWLKGVVLLFGFGIVLKDGLNFISYMMVDMSLCHNNNIKIAINVFQALFTLAQTKYLFKFSKVYIRDHNTGSSTGLMIVIAINLSTWVAAVIDETLHALHLTDDDEHTDEPPATASLLINSSAVLKKQDYDSPTGTPPANPCECTTAFCDAARMADTFLFPFLIEFSLVASCLLFVTWNNVGKRPPPCERVVKPSYRFYGHYKGSSLGAVMFFITFVFLILLGTSSTTLEEKSYATEITQLNLYVCFLTFLEFLMLVATLIGFYLLYRICRPLEKASMLDQVLLILCVGGPLVYNIFSIIAVITGEDNKETFWVFTLIYPLVDELQCLLQLVFILYGLRREPITSASAKQAAAQLKHGIKEHLKRSVVEESSDADFDNKTFLRSRHNSLTTVVTRLAGPQPPSGCEVKKNLEVRFNENKLINPPDIVISPSGDENYEKDSDRPISDEQQSVESDGDYNTKVLKIVSEVHVARPDQLRFWLRDVMMFLLAANVCLWLFMSLSGTAFKVYQYESEFFGSSAWTTITMICRPLGIFFRMHSAGCLFEMWSFA